MAGGGIGVGGDRLGHRAGRRFGDRITAFYDFTNGDIRAATPIDAYGHGTHVAGLIAGSELRRASRRTCA